MTLRPALPSPTPGCCTGRYASEVLRAGLRTRWLGRQLQCLESTDSTNRVAFDLGRAGAPHGAVVIAETQTLGRGRLDRRFFSPPHQNLYTSILLRPPGPVCDAPTLVLAAAVAVADAVSETLGDPQVAEIKWPNDVLLGGLKTAGILMELATQGSRVDFAVLGIGVNLNLDRARFPSEFRDRATSLRSHSGARVDRTAFAQRLFVMLENAMDQHATGGFPALRERFDARFRMTGRRVAVREAKGAVRHGWVRGVNPQGALRVEWEDGSELALFAGDVTLALAPAGGPA